MRERKGRGKGTGLSTPEMGKRFSKYLLLICKRQLPGLYIYSSAVIVALKQLVVST
jgi:hypothetical protein